MVCGRAGWLLRAYLFNRSQFVSFGTTVSDKEHINCGVPQGSVSGALLFDLYINDLVNVSSEFNYVLFADDTNILYSDK